MQKIGVICAMKKEADRVAEAMTDRREEKKGAFTFTPGRLGGKDVVLGLCGAGKVSAALCTQAMILSYGVEAVLNSGVAGSLSPECGVFDVALSTALVQHDMDTTPIGDPMGLLSGLGLVELPGDPDLLKTAEEAARDLGLKTVAGVIATGDQFIATRAQKEKILKSFPAVACEMEGAAVAYAAYIYRVPVLVIRTVSDAFDGRNEVDYAAFAPRAAASGARLLTEIVRRL
ncbi:MAG: 5'-methylthioadenosine/adenosylhomocysteine nucleosidase [Clostridia bacterium]|nr:5'-methylthioadenosine/adenosylhomocysteine nucleosidase [Clostridia bacterium]